MVDTALTPHTRCPEIRDEQHIVYNFTSWITSL